jgi:hypothetical protein
MERALSQVDILTSIISHIDARHTLAGLARVSQALSTVALDHLWRNIDSIVLLARCMPMEYWDEVEIYHALVGGYTSQLVRLL